MAVRNLLHISKLSDFSEWLASEGWIMEDPKGYYEVLRAKRQKRTLVVYKKLDAKEHLSVADKDVKILLDYFKRR